MTWTGPRRWPAAETRPAITTRTGGRGRWLTWRRRRRSAGDLDRAEALARAITGPDRRARALAGLAEAAADAGDLDRAQALARAITDPDRRARALADLAEVAAGAGDLDRAQALAEQAEAAGPGDHRPGPAGAGAG